jgi:hypothetical protein
MKIINYLSLFLLISTATINSSTTKTVNVATINPQSQNSTDQLILQYAPDVYLAKGEEYLPLTMESYLSAPETGMYYLKNRNDTTSATGRIKGIFKKLKVTTIIPPGQLTPEKMANQNLYKDLTTGKRSLYLNSSNRFNNGEAASTLYKTPLGETFTNKKDTEIKTPYYAIYSERGVHAYIQYFFTFGYNGTYKVVDAGPITISEGHHRMDLEHVVLQFNKQSVQDNKPELLRIGFLAHGGGEGKWVNAKSADLVFRDKTHITSYAAYHGHGMYPLPGTYVRIFGRANDITNKGTLWNPAGIIRLERPENSGYDVKTMGWIAYPGDLGPEGVGGFVQKDFFGQPEYEDGGKDYRSHYFKPETSPSALKTSVGEPHSLQMKYNEKIIIFNPQNLPPKEIVVKSGTQIVIEKENQPALKIEKKDAPNQSMQSKGFMVEKLEGEGTLKNKKGNYSIILPTPQKAYLFFKNANGEKAQTTVSVRE